MNAPEDVRGSLDAGPFRFGIVVARFNEFITSRLLQGATDALIRSGARPENVVRVWVPGSWEIPLAAQTLAEYGNVNAIVALGCLIRGETTHFDYIAAESARGIAEVTLESGIPISNGILTVENLDQAIDRAGAKAGNKGVDAALAAIEMANLIATISRK